MTPACFALQIFPIFPHFSPWPPWPPPEVNDLLRRGRLLRCHTLLVNHLLTLQGPFGRRKLLRETLADPVGRGPRGRRGLEGQHRTEPLEDHWRKYGEMEKYEVFTWLSMCEVIRIIT